MIHGNGGGTKAKGFYDTTLLDAYRRGRQSDSGNLSTTVTLVALLGDHLQGHYGGRYYAKAQNLVMLLTDAYNNALAEYDLLVLPTTPMKATPLPASDASKEEIVNRALEMVVNACPFDISGHPAMSIPWNVGRPPSRTHGGRTQIRRGFHTPSRPGIRGGYRPDRQLKYLQTSTL